MSKYLLEKVQAIALVQVTECGLDRPVYLLSQEDFALFSLVSSDTLTTQNNGDGTFHHQLVFEGRVFATTSKESKVA